MFIGLADLVRAVFVGRRPRLIGQHDDWFNTVALPGSKDYFGGKGAHGAPLQVPCLVQNRGAGIAYEARYCARIPKGIDGVLNDVWYASRPFELEGHSEPLMLYLHVSNEPWVRGVLADLAPGAPEVVEAAVCRDGRGRSYRFLADGKRRVWGWFARLTFVTRPAWADWQ